MEEPKAPLKVETLTDEALMEEIGKRFDMGIKEIDQ